jgi:uncharacterized membrane protein
MQNPPPNQPGYGNQYGAPPPPLPNPPVGEANAKTALGLEANLGAALGYPIGIIALIIFIMEKENRFARFHALQSLLFHVAWIVVFIVLLIVGTIFGILMAAIASTMGSGLGALVGLVMTLLWLAVVAVYIGGLLFAAFKAYGGNWFKLPIIGNMAEKMVNK